MTNAVIIQSFNELIENNDSQQIPIIQSFNEAIGGNDGQQIIITINFLELIIPYVAPSNNSIILIIT